MSIVKVKKIRNHSVKVISSKDQSHYISLSDKEMDKRATEAVRSAVAKAEFCKKPVAGYDLETQKVYVKYANGEKKYVE
ncbi:MAG: hypothetical protein ACI4DW_04600 [Lachnospiraceae bacterium]